jgi:hypothetical protein
MNRFILVAAQSLLLSAFGAACSTALPSKWAEGGARLELPRARWVLVDSAVDILPTGAVFVNSEHVFTVDRAGRVTDSDGQPVALLLPDGRVVGPGDEALGNVGTLNASLPDEPNAWISVMPTGEIVRYLDDGERMNFGAWLGCNAPQTHITCTLITHILGMRIKDEQDRQRAAASQFRGGLAPTGSGLGLGAP